MVTRVWERTQEGAVMSGKGPADVCRCAALALRPAEDYWRLVDVISWR